MGCCLGSAGPGGTQGDQTQRLWGSQGKPSPLRGSDLLTLRLKCGQWDSAWVPSLRHTLRTQAEPEAMGPLQSQNRAPGREGAPPGAGLGGVREEGWPWSAVLGQGRLGDKRPSPATGQASSQPAVRPTGTAYLASLATALGDRGPAALPAAGPATSFLDQMQAAAPLGLLGPELSVPPCGAGLGRGGGSRGAGRRERAEASFPRRAPGPGAPRPAGSRLGSQLPPLWWPLPPSALRQGSRPHPLQRGGEELPIRSLERSVGRAPRRALATEPGAACAVWAPGPQPHRGPSGSVLGALR